MTDTVPNINVYASSASSNQALGADASYQSSFWSFSGRIGRVRFLAYSTGVLLLFSLVFGVAEGMRVVTNNELLVGLLLTLSYIPLLIGQIAFGRRRLHDLDKSGRWMLLNFVPLANLGLGIYLIFFPGSKQDNRFGPPPAANSTGVTVVACVFPAIIIIGMLSVMAVP